MRGSRGTTWARWSTCEPIAAGIENTNYFVTTAKGRYVLTLYERLPAEELPFYLNLMAHLARAGVECPAPEPDRTGALFSLLNGKPAGLVTRLDGMPVLAPDVRTLRGRGRSARPAARRLRHVSHAPHQSARAGMVAAGRARGAALSRRRAERAARQRAQVPHGFGRGALPKGAIHGDLFCDNVLFSDSKVSGIIDFGFAATDFLAYDLAIAVNDWCIARDGAQQGALVPELVAAMAGAYDGVRPLTRRRAHAVVGAAARGGAALLAVAALRPASAAPGRALPRARPRAVRAHPARSRPHHATVSRPGHRCRQASEAMSAGPDGIAFERLPALRGVAWLRDAYGMLSLARLPWLMLMLLYYLILGLIDFLPYVGQIAAPILKPVFAVGFLAAAWSQERGGTPEPKQLFVGFRSNLWALLPLGVVLVAGITLAVLGTALVDDGKLLDALSGKGARDELPLADEQVQLAMLFAAACALPVMLAMWFAPALVVFQDCSAWVALRTSLIAALANWRRSRCTG